MADIKLMYKNLGVNKPLLGHYLRGVGIIAIGIGLHFAPMITESRASEFQPQNQGFWGVEEKEAQDKNKPAKEAHKEGAETEFDESLNLNEREYRQVFRHATQQVASQLRKRWRRAEMSNQDQWVSYENDLSTRRTVDFAANEIRITTLESNSEFQRAMRGFIKQQLEEVISASIQSANESDPVLKIVRRKLKLSTQPRYGTEELVLSELFASAQPSKQQVARQADKLLMHSYIRFRQQLAANGDDKVAYLENKVTYVVPLPKDRVARKARQYSSMIRLNSEKMDIPSDVLFAIIHTESYFNPIARSVVPAFGLMQIVPSTAGRDATRHLYKKPRVLSPSYLFNPEKNIEIGSAYLNLIYFHYLKEINKPLSRMYCAIAAYNTGTSNVAKAFISRASMESAAAEINKLSDEQVLRKLINNLPHQETRDYLKKVMKRKRLYPSV
ncbi:MAG: hypothetical protein COB04_15825 [Gammaproteobacteria bacterium]|nr:MAG: hypothetical protein COB04_15825 [Gammaproteobacteria bacterium]